MPFRDRPVSIEIGTDAVKVAQVIDGRGGVREIRVAEQALPGPVSREMGVNSPPVAQAVRSAMAQARIRSRTALISLPRRQVTARIAAFPRAEASELRQVIQYDLSDHVPFPLEQVVVDFQILGTSRDQPGLLDVLVVAAQREMLLEYLALAAELRLRPVVVMVDGLALHDITRVAGGAPTGLTLTLDIGARAATINVSEQGRLLLSRSVALGVSQLALAMKDDLGATTEEAQRILETEGLGVLDREPRPHRAAAWLDNIRGEMRRSALSFGAAATSKVLLGGAGAAIPGIKAALEAEFGIAVTVLSVARLFPGAQLVGGSAADADRCLSVIAQGLRPIGGSSWQISLLPPEVVQARRSRRLRVAGAAGALCVVAAVALGYVNVQRQIDRGEAEKISLTRQVEIEEQNQAYAVGLARERDYLRQQRETLDQTVLRRHTALELLRTMSLYAPKEIVVTRFTLRPEQPLIVRGNAPDSATVADLQVALARSPLITRVSLERADRTSDALASRGRPPRGSPSNEQVTFTMTAHLWTEVEPGTRPRSLTAIGRRRQ